MIQHFYHYAPKFNLGFQSKLKCFLKAGHTFIMLRFVPYPCTLSSNELIILRLDTGSASDIEILGLKIRIIQLFRSLRKKHSGRVKLQISRLWKSTRILFFKKREWKSVEVKIIPCFQQKGKYRGLYPALNTCDFMCLTAPVKHHRDSQNHTAVTKQLRFVRTLMHSPSEREKSSCKTNSAFATWLNVKASLEILKLELHTALRAGSEAQTVSSAQLWIKALTKLTTDKISQKLSSSLRKSWKISASKGQLLCCRLNTSDLVPACLEFIFATASL